MEEICRGCGDKLTFENWYYYGKDNKLYECMDCGEERKRQVYLDTRKTVIDQYGGKCCNCKEANIDNLILNFKDYSKNNRTYRIKGRILFAINNNYPNDFQIICKSCHYKKIKEYNNFLFEKVLKICEECNNELTDENWNPGDKERKKLICKECIGRRGAKKRLEIKKQVIDHYGGECDCCGESILEFLCIDHKGGRGVGSKHRKETGLGGKTMYKFLIENNYPEEYRVLCWNCNFAEMTNEGCIHKKV